jgi:hypothetical protein
MRLLSTLTALALGLVVASSVSAEDKAQKKAKKAAKPVTGVVTEIKRDSETKDSGTITVKVQAKAKKGQTAPDPVEKTFKVTEATKFETKGKGKKGTATNTEAKFTDLSKDARVTVSFKDDVAVSVTILPAAKKKNKQ